MQKIIEEIQNISEKVKALDPVKRKELKEDFFKTYVDENSEDDSGSEVILEIIKMLKMNERER